MSNIKLSGHTWDTSSIYDAELEKTQKAINVLVEGSMEELIGDNIFDAENPNIYALYIQSTSMSLKAADSNRLIAVSVEPNSNYIVKCGGTSRKRIAVLTGTVVASRAVHNYQEVAGEPLDTTISTDSYTTLVLQLFADSDTDKVPDNYYSSIEIRKYSGITAKDNIAREVADYAKKCADGVAEEGSLNLWDYGVVSENTLILANTGATRGDTSYNTTDFIPVSPGQIIYGRGARFYCYDANMTAMSDKTGVLNNLTTTIGDFNYYVIPDGAAYFRICARKDDASADQFRLFKASYFETILKQASPSTDSRIIYCLGDSITRGMYAESGASSSSGPTDKGYPYWIGEINGYTVVNLGNSGSGWANVGAAETIDDQSVSRNAKDVVDDNTFSDADIVTLAFGVNDWKGAAQDIILGDMTSTSGDGTVVGNMKYCIEQISTKKPTAQIIVLLPFNTNRQWDGMDTMTVENNWAFGYAYRYNQTLEDYRTAIRTCAEYYNIKVIDLEEVCPINRLNIRGVCGDGLHPTKAFHKQIGQALAPLIH